MREKSTSISTTKSTFNYIVLILIFLLSGFVLYNWYVKKINGPFISLDEPTYFNLARAIRENFSYMGHKQYNPLYPLITSLAFLNNNIILAYRIIQIFNILIYSSMVFPLYLICKRFFIKKMLCYVLPAVIIFLPWKSMVNLVWAEPLYYTLFAWCMFFFVYFYEKKTFLRAILLGTFLALLFYAKQAGLVLLVATVLTFLIEFFFMDKRNTSCLRINSVVPITTIVLIMPWLIRNIRVGGGLLGYSGEISKFKTALTNFLDLIEAFLYQFSYASLALYVVYLIVFIIVCKDIKTYGKNNQLFIILTAFFFFGIMLLSALHRLDRQEVPYGRYISTIFPFILIVTISYIVKNKSIQICKSFLILVAMNICILTMGFSPLPNSLFGYGYLNNFDLALWNDIFIKTNHLVYEPKDTFSVIILPLALFLLSCIFIFVNKRTVQYITLITITLAMLYGGFRSNYYVYRLSNNTSVLNNMYRFCVEKDISVDNLYKDTNVIKNKYNGFFWFKKEPNQVSIIEDGNELIFDFGEVKHSSTKEYYIITDKILDYNLIYKNSKYFLYYTNKDLGSA